MKLNYYDVQTAKTGYYTAAAGVRAACPAALGDPMIAALVLQVEIAELALRARLDALTEDSDA